MARGVPVNDKTRVKILRLFDQGMSRNEIARKLSVSTGVVSRICRAAGRSFVNRAQTAAASKVLEFDMAAARVELAQQMHANAKRSLSGLEGPFLVYSFGGKDNTYQEHTLDEAPVSARREAQTVGAIAFDKLTKALEKDTTGIESAHSLLDSLAAGFRHAAAQYETPADGL